MQTFVTHLECALTGERFPARTVQNLSSAGKPLLVRYDLGALRRAVRKETLTGEGFWRYAAFLPVTKAENRVSLGEVVTPLIEIAPNLLVKDEGRLPTGSFKARGLALAVAMAKELGLAHLAMPSNGNAGAALAAYAARAGLKATVFCPADTPEINLSEIEAQGAACYRVNGLIDDCGRLVGAGKAAAGWFDVSTLKEPYRIEGKKTMGLELAEQLGWTLPDVIVYPTGGGTGLIGMWKVFKELTEIGWLKGRLPRMVAVQASGCAPIVRAFEQGVETAVRWENAATVAAGIRVPAAIGDFLILRAVRESGGTAIAVDDAAILAARDRCAREQGLLLSPEGAATLAAYDQLRATGAIRPEERTVLFNCATGLKYPLPRVTASVDRHAPGDFARFR